MQWAAWKSIGRFLLTFVILQDLEQKDAARLERLHDAWDRQNRDPDDVFFRAQERRQEIKEQMRDLQKALNRQRPRKTKQSKRT